MPCVRRMRDQAGGLGLQHSTHEYMKTTLITIGSAAMLLLAVGCQKDNDEPAPSAPVQPMEASISVEWLFMQDMDDLVLGTTVLHDSLGHAVKLDTLRFYMSGAQAMGMSGEAVADYTGVRYLVDAAHADHLFPLGAITTPHLHELDFDLGLDAEANAGDPATAGAPLDDPSMFFTGEWAGMGYKFLQATGHADLDGSGQFMTPVRFETGMAMALTSVSVHVHADLQDGDQLTIPLHVDLARLFAGLDLASNAQPDMHSPEAARIMHNLATSIGGH